MRRVLLAALGALILTAPAASARDRFDTKVFAVIPKPGYPAMAYVGPNDRVYEGTYTNPSGDGFASRVFEYSAKGTLLRSWVVKGQDLSQPHGIQVGTMGASGRLFLLDKSPPRVIKLDRRTGAQRDYSVFPGGAIPNYSAWGPDGSLYVTDYEGAKIFRVPPGGGAPQVWLESPQLDGGPFGTTGISLMADRRTLLVSQQSAAGLGAGNPTTGRLLKIPINPDNTPGPISQLWESLPLDGPDGFAIAKSGAIYVACLLSNQIVVVNPDGTTQARFPQAPLLGLSGASVPFDSPSSARFLGTRLMVANQSFVAGTAANQVILDVEAGERGLKEFIPKAKKKRRP